MMGTEVSNSSDGPLTNPSELYARCASSINLDCNLSISSWEDIRKICPRESEKVGMASSG